MEIENIQDFRGRAAKVEAAAKELAEVRKKIARIKVAEVLVVCFNARPLSLMEEDEMLRLQNWDPPSDLGDLFRDVRTRTLEYWAARESEWVKKLAELGVEP